MDVCPRPALREWRKRHGRRHGDGRQRLFLVITRELARLLLIGSFEHDEREPGPQTVAGGAGRRVPPKKILVVELDEWEIVGLELGIPMLRLRPHHHRLGDADDVAGSDEWKFLVNGFRVHCHVNRNGRTLLERAIAGGQRVDLRDRAADAATEPRAEGVLADGQTHAASSIASSWAPTT